MGRYSCLSGKSSEIERVRMRYLITIECVIACNADRNKWNSFLYSFLFVFLNEFKREHKMVLDKNNHIMCLYKGVVNDYDGVFMKWAEKMSDSCCVEEYGSDCPINDDSGIVRFSEQLPVVHNVVVCDMPNFIQKNKIRNKNNLNMIDIDQAKAQINKDPASPTINITANGSSKVKLHDINAGNVTNNASKEEEKSSVLNIIKKVMAMIVKLFGGN